MNLARLDLFVGETFAVYAFCLNAGWDIHDCHVFLLDSLLKSISLSTDILQTFFDTNDKT